VLNDVLQASQLDCEVVQVTAVKALMDLLLTHGVHVFDSCQPPSTAVPVLAEDTFGDSDDNDAEEEAVALRRDATDTSADRNSATGSFVIRSLIDHVNSEVIDCNCL
jgi:hypothetical protein